MQCKKIIYLMTSIIALGVLISGMFVMKNQKESKVLRIAFGSPWMNIHPGLQHTLVGDLVLSNQFEALVGFNENGAYVPLAAKEWLISEDFKSIEFKIDTSKEFSDGVKLTAKHFKDSWISALKLDPKSANSSLLDVFYKVVGFESFEKTGELPGVHVIDDETLVINFSTPFRMALEHLGGNRFAAFREVNKNFLGTGAYVIESSKDNHLHFIPNENFFEIPKTKIDLQVVLAKDAVGSLIEGKIDVLAYAAAAAISPELGKHKNLTVIVGQDAVHRAIYPNSQSGRIFSDVKMRKALQFLAYKYFLKKPLELGNPDFTSIDHQVYLPYQAGRLEIAEVVSKLMEGEEYVADLLQSSRKMPIVLFDSEENPLRAFLEYSGLTLSNKSKVVSKPELIKAIYSGQEADIIPGGFGVASGDPDGIYHLLGNNGAITSPMLKNNKVSEILEDGRKIVNQNEIDPFYKKVSLAILGEVPIVHLGFNKAVAIYRNDKVSVSSKILRRNEGHLHIFEAK